MQRIYKLLATAAICAISSNANAIENNYKPYVGLNYAYGTVNAKHLRSYHNSGSIMLGSVYNKFFGTELFYQYSDTEKYSNRTGLRSSSFTAYGLDMLAYLPVGWNCKEWFSFVATAGIGEYDFTIKPVDAKSSHDRGWGYRFGGGVSYNITDNWSTRFLTRYVIFDKLHNMDHMIEYSVGLRYTF